MAIKTMQVKKTSVINSLLIASGTDGMCAYKVTGNAKRFTRSVGYCDESIPSVSGSLDGNKLIIDGQEKMNLSQKKNLLASWVLSPTYSITPLSQVKWSSVTGLTVTEKIGTLVVGRAHKVKAILASVANKLKTEKPDRRIVVMLENGGIACCQNKLRPKEHGVELDSDVRMACGFKPVKKMSKPAKVQSKGSPKDKASAKPVKPAQVKPNKSAKEIARLAALAAKLPGKKNAKGFVIVAK